MELLGNQSVSPFDQLLEDVRILSSQGVGQALPEAVSSIEDRAEHHTEIEHLDEAHILDPEDFDIRLR